MRMLTLGWLTLSDVGPVDLIDAAAAGGFDAAGIRITGRRLTDEYPEVVASTSTKKSIREHVRNTGLVLSNISAYHFHPEVTMSELKPVLDTVAELGAPTVVANGYDGEPARFFDRLCEYADAAQSLGIRVALEFMMYSEVKTLAQAYQIVRDAKRPNLGLLIDPLHLARSGGTAADLATVDANCIYFAQLCDGPSDAPSWPDLRLEARNGRLHPGVGGLPLHDFLNALPPELELECEAPVMAEKHLPPAERARIAGAKLRQFLSVHEQQQAN